MSTKPYKYEGEEAVPWVVCAAMRSKTTGFIIVGARHFDSHMREQMRRSGGIRDMKKGRKVTKEWSNADDGFIDQYGNFLDRREAWVIAEKNGQIRRRLEHENGILYSENLY